ncbi:MAG: hypothetical protein Q7K34_01275 [archaeon]|nr:hypothetical protein [archaeon]
MVDPQTGESFLSKRAIHAIEGAYKTQQLGKIGEKLVAKMHPHWLPAKPRQEGYDFIMPRSKGNLKVEVKTLGLEATLSRKIYFRVRQGHWHNQAANLVLVVSPAGVYRLDANSLRDYIKHHLLQLPHLEQLSYQRGNEVWIEVNLDRLLALKIGHPANINPGHCRDFFLEELGLKKRKPQRK